MCAKRLTFEQTMGFEMLGGQHDLAFEGLIERMEQGAKDKPSNEYMDVLNSLKDLHGLRGMNMAEHPLSEMKSAYSRVTTACENYTSTKNPFTDKGKTRKEMISAIGSICEKDYSALKKIPEGTNLKADSIDSGKWGANIDDFVIEMDSGNDMIRIDSTFDPLEASHQVNQEKEMFGVKNPEDNIDDDEIEMDSDNDMMRTDTPLDPLEESRKPRTLMDLAKEAYTDSTRKREEVQSRNNTPEKTPFVSSPDKSTKFSIGSHRASKQ